MKYPNAKARTPADEIDLVNKRYYHILRGDVSVLDLYGVAKSDDRGDDAEGITAPPHSHNVKTKKTHEISLDLADGTRMRFPNERALAEWTAIQARVRKNSTSEEPTMPTTPLDLSALVKNHGIGALCRHIVKSASSFGINEHQLVRLATEDAARTHPHDTPEIAFAKIYEESAELREAIDIAKGAAFQNDLAVEFEKDARDAMEELNRIGKERWGSLSPSQRFARAFETNPELAKRAHRRPGPSTSFPHPTAKALPRVNVDGVTLKPQFVTETSVDDPQKALDQLKFLGRQKWPSLSESESFIRALSDPENADLVNLALARPNSSSPPRQ